tara:strand:- start:349 stop:3312 length:2964 start_codon:yes stop_codon:yes gene_type:complete
MKKIIIFLGLVMFIMPIYSQVVVNEYSVSNLTGYLDNYDSEEDWIELYNTSGSSVNIGGYHLSDKSSNPTKWEIPAGTIIPANGYLVFWCSGRDEASGGNYHTNFKLKQTKNTPEHVVFADTNGTVIDDLEIQKTQLEHAMGRSSNGSSDWKIFINPTIGSSNTGPSYLAYAQTPEMNLEAGFYPGSQSVEISSTEPNSTIHYTLNGNLPDNGATEYTGALTVASTQVIKAIVVSNNSEILPSFISFNTYFINETHSLPVLSTSADELTILLNGDNTLKPHGTIEYFDIDGNRKDAGYGEYNKHGQDSWQFPQRSFDYIARDEMGYHDAINDKLLEYSERESFQRIIIRASGDDNYPGIDSSAHTRDIFIQKLANKNNLNVDMRRGERCVVYANGQFWGVYSIREKVSDSDYTDFYYDQDKYNIQYLMNWGGTWAQYGGQDAFDDWNEIHDFALNNDLSNQTNYDHVADEIDVTSLTDYILINSFVVCTDWINWNTSWWRGIDPSGSHQKWGYVLWDEDATFNHYINYTGVPDDTAEADPCYPEGITADPEQHIVLLNKLLENEGFRQYYITRYMDLMNTTFQEEEMIGVLEGIENSISPDMPQHIDRWGGSMNEWQDNVQKVKDFIIDRIDYIPGGLNDCYTLSGPYDITLNVEPEGAGQIQFNSITIENGDYPWSGSYNGGIDMLLEAVQSNSSYAFDHWELDNHTVTDVNAVNTSFFLEEADNITAVFTFTGGSDIVINEINYKDAVDFEVKDWVELYNNSDSTVDLSGWIFKDDDDLHEFIIPDGTTLAPDSYIVLAQSLVDFQSEFPSVSPVLGDFEFGLSGGGELVRLYDNTGILVDSVTYNDESPWPTEADGNGPTLELISPDLDNNLGENWDACAAPGFEHGTPTTVNNDCTLGIEDFSNVKVLVYPNPMKTEATIIVSNITSPIVLKVYDMLGREITTMESNTNKFIFTKGNLNTGIYLLKILTLDQTMIQTQKLIIE